MGVASAEMIDFLLAGELIRLTSRSKLWLNLKEWSYSVLWSLTREFLRKEPWLFWGERSDGREKLMFQIIFINQ